MDDNMDALTSVSAHYEDMIFHNILQQNIVEVLSSSVPEIKTIEKPN